MKKFYFFLVIAMMAVATSASAQFVQSGANNQSRNNNQGGNFFSQMSTDNYNRIYVSYNPVQINASGEYAKDANTDSFLLKNSFSLGYLHANNIVDGLPLYIEWGGNIQYFFGKKKVDGYDYGYDDEWEDEWEDDWGDEWARTMSTRGGDGDNKITANMLSLNIPVNIALRLQFNDQKIGVTPYMGLNFRVNLFGNQKFGDNKVNLFKEDDMGKDNKFGRFQVGFNAGVGFSFSKFHLGVGYLIDFNKLCGNEDTVAFKMGMVNLALGFNF